MSVINKMLQDLEQRQQPAATPRSGPLAPMPGSNTKPRYLWLLLLLASLVVVGWLWQIQHSQAQPFTQTSTPSQADTLGAAVKQPVAIKHNNKAADVAGDANLQQTPQHPSGETLQAEPANIVAALTTTEPTVVEMVTSASTALHSEPTQQASAKVLAHAAATQPAQLQPMAVKPQATVDKQPLSAEAQQQNMLRRANASEATGDTPGAIVIWQQIVAQQPAEANGYLNLARLWLKQQQIVSASQVLLQARHNGVQSAEINMQLAQLAVRQGQWQQALEFLSDQFELAAEPEYFGFKATVLQQLQQYSAALALYQRLHQLQPEQSRWSLGAALASEQAGEVAQAHQYYQHAWQYRQVLSASSHDFIQQRLKATEP